MIQFLIESGKSTSEQDIDNLLSLLNAIQKPFNCRFYRIPQNKIVNVIDKEALTKPKEKEE